MFWEFVTTIFAGLGAAGIALLIRLISAKTIPLWLVPACAGAGMLAFQIYSEYTWYSHQKSLLPPNVEVVTSVEEASMWRPWTFIYPRITRFVALQVNDGSVNRVNQHLVLANIYLFERRRGAKHVHQVFHCEQSARANFNDRLEIPLSGEVLDEQWLLLAKTDPLLMAVCQAAGRYPIARATTSGD